MIRFTIPSLTVFGKKIWSERNVSMPVRAGFVILGALFNAVASFNLSLGLGQMPSVAAFSATMTTLCVVTLASLMAQRLQENFGINRFTARAAMFFTLYGLPTAAFVTSYNL
jgi:uncharacterized membrane protein